MDTRVYHHPIKKCCTCGKEYQPKTGRQKYCIECGRWGGQATCEQCGKIFTLTGGTTGRFCSRECWYTFFGGEKMAPRDCPVCSKTFKPRNADQKTCSRECGNKTQRRKIKVCVVCGKEFDSKRSNQVACSNQCAGIRKQKVIFSNCERCKKTMRVTGYLQKKFCSVECRRAQFGNKRHTTGGYILIRVGNYPGTNPQAQIL